MFFGFILLVFIVVVVVLGLFKIIENMEIGYNVMYG